MAAKPSLLVHFQPRKSSFEAIGVRASTLEPVYTASSESRPLPTVSKVAVPVAGATHLYQADPPPMFPAWLGSPASLVASTLVPLRLPVAGSSTAAAEKLSLLGVVAPDALTTSSAVTPTARNAPRRRSSFFPPIPISR